MIASNFRRIALAQGLLPDAPPRPGLDAAGAGRDRASRPEKPGRPPEAVRRAQASADQRGERTA